MNLKERLTVGIGMAFFGVMLMNVKDMSIATIGAILFGVGMTLFLLNIKD
mgnify:CR=1 FL=1